MAQCFARGAGSPRGTSGCRARRVTPEAELSFIFGQGAGYWWPGPQQPGDNPPDNDSKGAATSIGSRPWRCLYITHPTPGGAGTARWCPPWRWGCSCACSSTGVSAGAAVGQGAAAGQGEPGLITLLTAGTGELRLVGGGGRCAGRVEVKHEGEWGSVCQYDFWNDLWAKVVCRQLGCGRVLRSSPYAPFGQGTGRIWLHPFCWGNEMKLQQCPHRGWGQHFCGHENDVGVTCAGESGRGWLCWVSAKCRG